MSDDRSSQLDLENATCYALGGYVIAFSNLLFALERSTFLLMGLGARPELAYAAVGARTADPIVQAFSSVLHVAWADRLTSNDRVVLKALAAELNAIVEERNRLMHDAWMGGIQTPGEPPVPVARVRARRHGKGVEFQAVEYRPERLDEISTRVLWLSSAIFTIVQTGPGRLDSRYRVAGSRLVEAPD